MNITTKRQMDETDLFEILEVKDICDGNKIGRIFQFNPAEDYGERYQIHYPPETTIQMEILSQNVTKVPFDEDCYNMNTYPRGCLIIINMKHFHETTGLENYPRNGTERDAEELTKVFLKLGFMVEQYDDLTKDELLRVMKYTSRDNYNDLSCFVCALLTHGLEKFIYTVDSCVEIHQITRMFTGTNLTGKPKIFLIQACQGTDFMESVDVLDSVDGAMNENNKLSLPIEADFLYAYSTARGFYSWRHSRNGSWFIQTLCDVLREDGHTLDLVRLLTRVNRKLAKRTSSTKDEDTTNKRQIASIVSQLRKELYFPFMFNHKIEMKNK